MIAYSVDLDGKLVKGSEIHTLDTDLQTYIDTTKLPSRDMLDREIAYRSLSQVSRFTLGRRFGLRFGAVSSNGPFAGYYSLDQTVLAHHATSASAPNGDTSGKPNVQVRALFRAMEVGYLASFTRICIGTSTDGGVTYTPHLSTSRPLGWSGGKFRSPYNGVGAQNHYWTGAANSWLKNTPIDRGVTLLASFGGLLGQGSPLNITHYCLMIDSVAAYSRYHEGVIVLTARDNGI